MKARHAALVLLSFPLCAQVKFARHADRIAVEIDGKPFTEFFFGPETPKPYLHPLRAASGTIVTRLYPMQKVEGEAYDHPHHRGLWFTHGDVNGADFWSNEPNARRTNLGRVVLKQIRSVEEGPHSGVIAAEFEWRDPQGKVLLVEGRRMMFHSHPSLRILDLDITLTASEKVKFGDTKEGTFAIRLAPWLEEPHARAPASPPRTGRMVSSEGKQTEKEVWGSRAAWVDYFGEFQGEKLGVAVFDHPRNPRHPTFWHARAYGLFAANIFGLRDFLHDKNQDGSLTLAPGESLRFRYRVVIHPGDYRTADIPSLYKQYAAGS
ncbi:MAG TPA: PmoA family protein [Bryobacteraceae bacterium]|nr:PmoA family protein [Bryobacteraceae bacterium]